MARRSGIGIIGAGNISEAYLRLAPNFDNVAIVAIADIMPEAAKARAAQFNVRALKGDELLKDGEVEAVVNLTGPAGHYDGTKTILSAGQHCHTHKPRALDHRD